MMERTGHLAAAASEIGEASDVLSFEELFTREHANLFRALFLITGSIPEAEELMQDAFLKVWERWERVSEMENPAGYLFRVAVNNGLRRIRRIAMGAKRVLASGQPDDPFAAADLRDEVVRSLAALPERQRAAIVLTDLVDLSAEEAGKALGVTASTVRSLASQARQALRISMEECDV